MVPRESPHPKHIKVASDLGALFRSLASNGELCVSYTIQVCVIAALLAVPNEWSRALREVRIYVCVCGEVVRRAG